MEVANARNFLNWTRQQPWMVLHELAHAYHHQFLKEGFGNPDVAAAFRLRNPVEGVRERAPFRRQGGGAYALTDPQEYFAEGSEAFFGAMTSTRSSAPS